MSEPKRGKKTPGDRKRQRQSEEDKATDTQVDEPLKKRSRHVTQTSHRSQQIPSPQQPTYLETSDMDAIRRERRENAHRVLNEVLPALIARLRDVDRRAKAAADERGSYVAGQEGLTGPCSAAKRRKLTKQIKKLLDDATVFLRQQHELRETDISAYESQPKSNADQLNQLASDTALLVDQHRKLPESDDNAEDESKGCLDQLRLIINHPLLDQLRVKEDPPQRKGDESNDPLTPLRDTKELAELVAMEMVDAIDCAYSLQQCIYLYEPPPSAVAINSDNDVRAKGFHIIDRLVVSCERRLDRYQQYTNTNVQHVLNAIKEPLSFDCMRALDNYDTTNAIIWRRYATDVADRCEQLISFVRKHIAVLGQSMPEDSAADNLYS